MTRDEILDRIRKVQALAQKGTDGERQSAERRLAELMEKYHITLEDIEQNEDKEEVFWYRCKGEDWDQIFSQVAAVMGCLKFAYLRPGDTSKRAENLRRSAWDRPRGSNTVIICTYLKFIEITTAYELYQKSYNKQKDAFIYAFLMRNQLLPSGDSNHQPTPEELEMVARAAHMAGSIEKVNTNKQLGTGLYLEQ